jgi:translation initiation factor 6 (eIF-6)
MSDYIENEDLFDEENNTPKDEATQSIGSDITDNVVDDDVVTAVLLVKNKSGAVLPVTNLDSLKMERQANAHEVLRMCADVQDQISAIRVVGELAQIFQHINQSSLKAVADMLNIKVNGGSDE